MFPYQENKDRLNDKYNSAFEMMLLITSLRQHHLSSSSVFQNRVFRALKPARMDLLAGKLSLNYTGRWLC